MQKHNGRYSAASLSVVARTEPPRPEPPQSLCEQGKVIWRGIVAGFLPTWFQGCESILATYVETAVIERQIASELHTCGPHDDHWLELARLHVNVASSLANLGTKPGPCKSQ